MEEGPLGKILFLENPSGMSKRLNQRKISQY